jgi:hypothetical protein
VSTEAFERAFVAVSYLLGRRAAELGLGLMSPGTAANRAASQLSEPDRERRAQRLAVELLPVAQALSERRLA